MRYILLLIIVVLSCSEPYEFDSAEVDVEVIDAKISTVPGNSIIEIYLLSGEERLPLCNFDVKIISESGEEFEFDCMGGAWYVPLQETFAAQVGESYRFEATDNEGRIFRSGFDLVPEPIDFDLDVRDTTDTFLSTENSLVTRNVKSIQALVPPQEHTFYVKYEFYYAYEDHFSGDSIDVIDPREYVLFTNVDNGLSDRVIISVGIEERTNWRFWNFASTVPCLDPEGPCFNPCCGNPCCFFTENWPVNFYLVQEVMSKESYEYWENAQRLRSNDGLVFDTYPFPLRGNITCEECDVPFVGFFRAVTETSKKQPTIL